jgi:hypothetical protein
VTLWVAEAFGEKGAVVVFFIKMLGQSAQGEAQAAGGEVGLPLGFDDDEPPELTDERQAAGAGEWVPVRSNRRGP